MDSNLTDLHILKQVEAGTIPESALTKVRFTGESFSNSLTKAPSAEIRADGNVSDLLIKSGSQAGGWNFELASPNATGDTVFFDLLAGLMGNTWAAGPPKSIKNAASPSLSYFTVERSHVLPDASSVYFAYRDCVPVQLDLNLTAEQDITGSWTFMGGFPLDADTSSVGTGEATAANTNPIYTSSFHVGTLQEDGGDLDAYIQSISLSIHKNPRRIVAVSYPWGAGVGFGSWSITGTMNVYFSDISYYNKNLANTDLALTIPLDDDSGTANGNQLNIILPSIKFLSIDMNAAGKDQDLLQAINFQAVYDTTSECSIQFTWVPKADT